MNGENSPIVIFYLAGVFLGLALLLYFGSWLRDKYVNRQQEKERLEQQRLYEAQATIMTPSEMRILQHRQELDNQEADRETERRDSEREQVVEEARRDFD